MDEKNERNLNITISNPESESNEIIVSFSTIIRKMKKYLSVLIAAVVTAFICAFVYAAVTTHVKKTSLRALVSFNYDGIEKGIDPAGKDFDPNSIKNPAVIEEALTELNIDLDQLEYVRRGIRLKGIIPKDAYDRIAIYKSVLETGSGANAAAENILETSYFATQYSVYFDYNETSLTDSQAVELFNLILDKYNDYFYKTYGYNEAIGSAVAAISYEDYDYSEAIDVFSSSIKSLRSYVKTLANEDNTKFRSSVTGYTFNDLYEAINTINDIDLNKCSSYINVNNVTRDKETALAYCEDRIKALNRQKAQYEEELAAYNSAIDAYQKDQIIVFGGSAGDNSTTQSTVTSQQYDKMYAERNNITNELAATRQSINFYKEREESLKSKSVGSTDKAKKVEEQLAALSDKIDNLVELVSLTSEDYYVNVTFKNAYTVLAPATNSTSDKISRIIENAVTPLLVLEVVVVFVFLAVSFVEALICDSRRRKAEIAGLEYVDEDEAKQTKENKEPDTEEKKSEKPAESQNNAIKKKNSKK